LLRCLNLVIACDKREAFAQGSDSDEAIIYPLCHEMDCFAALAMTDDRPPYTFNVSRNRTGSPLDGAVTSPCHITRLPRTKVPTGQPVTRTPS
jgi:hypothetical protein